MKPYCNCHGHFGIGVDLDGINVYLYWARCIHAEELYAEHFIDYDHGTTYSSRRTDALRFSVNKTDG